jgi:hypothetical protein
MKLTKIERVYVPVSVKDELPEDKTAVFILENRGSSSLMPRMNLAYFEHPTNFNTGDEEDNYPTHWLKEQNNKYIFSEEELRILIKKIIWSADWDKLIFNLFNDSKDFYCHDECCANAQEDYDFKKCTIQCDKCKEE